MLPDSTARLILVRHGETVGRSSIRYYGRTDVALSDVGRAQMRAVRERLARELGLTHFAPVWSSPLCRAAEGARIICGPGTDVTEVKEFVEVDFGLFEGLTGDEIRERYPAEYAQWNRDRLAPDYAYPDGESRAAFTARVTRGLVRVIHELDAVADGHDAALIVAHRGVIRAIVKCLTGVEPQIELASIHILHRAENKSRWQAEALDVTEHLSHRPSRLHSPQHCEPAPVAFLDRFRERQVAVARDLFEIP